MPFYSGNRRYLARVNTGNKWIQDPLRHHIPYGLNLWVLNFSESWCVMLSSLSFSYYNGSSGLHYNFQCSCVFDTTSGRRYKYGPPPDDHRTRPANQWDAAPPLPKLCRPQQLLCPNPEQLRSQSLAEAGTISTNTIRRRRPEPLPVPFGKNSLRGLRRPPGDTIKPLPAKIHWQYR